MTAHTTFAAVLASLACLLPPGTCAGAGAPDDIPALLQTHARFSAFAPPPLSATQLETLRAGDAVIDVRTANPADNGDVEAVGVYALQVLEAPRLLLWLAVMGANDERDYRLKRAMLARGPDGSYVRYQNVNLPWPFQDRHWVIDCHKNLALAQGSDGRAWEHYWQLHADGQELLAAAFERRLIDGLDAADVEDDIYLPVNRGAWAMVELDPQRTLVIAWVDAELGGAVPDALVRTFTRRQLKAGFERLFDMSTRVHRLYDDSDPVHDGFGRPLSVADARDAAQAWQDERLAMALD